LSSKTTVVIPTYNEANNLPTLAADLLSLELENLTVLIVDDDSPDGTGEIADDIHLRYPDRFDVIHRAGKQGLGTAYVAGFQRALAEGADYIVQMDADFSHSPHYIPKFLETVPAYDVIVGSRYVPGGKLDERWSAGRYFLSWWANQVYTRAILGLAVRDVTAGFKLWRRRVLENIDLQNVQSSGYVFQVEMAYLTEKKGFRVLEYPIYFEDRRIGRSKMSIPIKFEAAWRVWEIRWRHRNAKQ